jgi:hypothetical protein
VGRLRARGLVTPEGTLTDLGRETKAGIEWLTDELAVAPYLGLAAGDLDRLAAALEPIAAALTAAGSRWDRVDARRSTSRPSSHPRERNPCAPCRRADPGAKEHRDRR